MPLPKAENRTFEGCIHMQMLFGHSGLAMLTPFRPAPVADPDKRDGSRARVRDKPRGALNQLTPSAPLCCCRARLA